jgi:hypothetical protein
MKLEELRAILQAPSSSELETEAPASDKLDPMKRKPEPWERVGVDVVLWSSSPEKLKSVARCEHCGHMRTVTPSYASNVYAIEPCTACAR